jgi:hypothetical protein
MKILIGCEFSGVVREAFRAKGHDAWSNDILPAVDSSPYHLQMDVFDAIASSQWDMAIFHPPCTYLCSSGLHWNGRVPGRQALTDEAVLFVKQLLDCGIPKIALENPIGCLSTKVRKPNQIIQPYQYGHDASKSTCLWLTNLPPLTPTKYIEPIYGCSCKTRFAYEFGKYGCPNCHGEGKVRPIWGNQTPTGQNKIGPSADRWAERSMTYTGIASAMAEQWGS